MKPGRETGHISVSLIFLIILCYAYLFFYICIYFLYDQEKHQNLFTVFLILISFAGKILVKCTLNEKNCHHSLEINDSDRTVALFYL